MAQHKHVIAGQLQCSCNIPQAIRSSERCRYQLATLPESLTPIRGPFAWEQVVFV